MKKKKVTDDKMTCEFCKRSFVQEQSFLKHICEYKHRWLEKDRRGNQIGYQCYLEFYKKHSTSKKERTYEDYIRSAYYTAFAKFGNYVMEVNCVNIPRYIDYLLKEKTKIDTWTSDSVYTEFLLNYLKTEDHLDAVQRSVETCMNLAEQENTKPNDLLRYGNRNKICHEITKGKLSPWMLYQSESGVAFIDDLNEDQVKIVYDYIQPTQWAIKFSKMTKEVEEVKNLLTELKW
jgi:hypothetical protein